MMAIETTQTAAIAAAPAVHRPSALMRLLRRPLGAASVAFLALLVVAALAPGLLTPVDPLATDLGNVLAGPSLQHWLGTDALGRDMLSRVIFGTAPALTGALITIVVGAVIAVPLGLACALFKPVDNVMSKVSDVLMSIPGTIVLLMVLAVAGSMDWAMAAFGLLVAPGLIRITRGSALTIVEEPYIAAARVFGAGKWKIAFSHILPRVIGPVLVSLSLIAASALVVQAGLNFLGLGLVPPTPSWGGLVADGAAALTMSSWTLVPGGGIIALAAVAFVLFGDAVRDVSTESWAAGRSLVRRKGRAKAPTQNVARTDATLPEQPEAVLRVRDLTIAFPDGQGGETVVVDSVSFDIARGEAVGVVGESGCGKTVTGLGVLGMLPARGRIVKGSIVLDGVDVTALPTRQRDQLRGTSIAFVSQEPMTALDPLFTVGSQIGEAVRAHTKLRGKAVRARVLELLEQVRIVDPARVAKSYPHEISGGMAQRVSLAIALAGSPLLLIADEPTTALDVTVQAEVIDLLTTIQQETGMAVMLISHDWGVVSTACTRSVVMYAGEVVERAAVEEILASPLHPYTAGLLAANPHFAVPGERLATIPGSVPPPSAWPTSCHFADRCPLATQQCREAPVAMVLQGQNRLTRCLRVDALQKERQRIR